MFSLRLEICQSDRGFGAPFSRVCPSDHLGQFASRARPAVSHPALDYSVAESTFGFARPCYIVSLWLSSKRISSNTCRRIQTVQLPDVCQRGARPIQIANVTDLHI